MQQSQSNRYGTQPWTAQLNFYYIILICIFCSLSQQIFASTTPLEINSQYFSHICSAQIQSVQAAKADTDLTRVPNQGWQNVSLPDNWETRWNNYSGSVWYKIHWQYHCPNSQDNFSFALLIDRINLAGIVYNNNELIWRDKSLAEPLSRSWNMPRYWILPTSSIKQGQNEILIRVVGLQSQNSGLGNVIIGNIEHITNLHDKLIFERRTLFSINLLITVILGSIAFVIWLLRRQETAFGWFAINTCLWALFICNVILLKPFPLIDSLLHAKLNIVFLIGYAYTSCLFVWRFSNVKFPKTEKILTYLSVTLSFLLLSIPNTYLTYTLSIGFFYSCALFTFNCIFIQWIAFKKRKLDLYWLAAIFFTFIIISIHDIFLLLKNPFNGLMWTPFAAPITSLAISFILGWRIAKNMHHIEKFNETLKDTVETVTFDLEQSLDKKYQLEVDNMRLQERLNLSHELHDGLGGSIVRSMILLEHTDKVEKDQVMSMFKLLRNDLRQVIDFGSSLGTKVPPNPIIWVAPIRHRFVQIFEEMNIQSTWIFSNHWNLIPPTLYCLTLSRVAEEALTNIVKHSHATDVEVSLIEDEQFRLILEIKDNGKGFLVNSVQEGLHVGLQSMQVRVKRIGGDFHISSEVGLTVIRASIPLKTTQR